MTVRLNRPTAVRQQRSSVKCVYDLPSAVEWQSPGMHGAPFLGAGGDHRCLQAVKTQPPTPRAAFSRWSTGAGAALESAPRSCRYCVACFSYIHVLLFSPSLVSAG